MFEKKDFRVYLFSGLAIFFVVIFVVVAVINGITAKRSDEILAESVEGHLISAAAAADDFVEGKGDELLPFLKTDIYMEAEDDPSYAALLANLRETVKKMDVSGIYIIYKATSSTKANNWFFVLETDIGDEHVYCGQAYVLDAENASIFNDVWEGKDVRVVRLKDDYNTFRTYAVPIVDGNNEIVAVLGIDIKDEAFTRQNNMRIVNNIILYASLAALFVFMFFVVKWMADRNAAIGRQLEEQEERYKTAITSAADAIFDYNIPTGRVYVGRQFFGMVGEAVPEEDGTLMPIETFYGMLGTENAKILREGAYRMASKEIDSIENELEVIKPDGNTAWISLRGKAHYGKSGIFARASGSVSEITVRKNLEAEIHSMAYYDKLTKIPNRAFLFQTLNELIKRKNDKFALYFIDLDNFKQVNDNFGHDAGDSMLRHFAEFMKQIMGKGNMAYRPAAGALDMAARFGGDEFVVINTSAKNMEDAVDFAEKMLISFNTSEESKLAREYSVSMSIGVAFFPDHADNAEQLIKCADIAMYHAKKKGKNSVKAYNPHLPVTE